MKDEIAEIQISYSTGPTNRKITKSEEAYQVLIEFWSADLIEVQEEFKAILMNNAGSVLGIVSLSKGGITGTVVDVRLLFGIALKCTATSLIIAHNHPSGQLKPSQQDISLTHKVRQAGQLLDIKLNDHLIIGKDSYLSLLDEGVL